MQAGGRRFDPVILHHLCAIARVGDKVVEEAARSWKKLEEVVQHQVGDRVQYAVSRFNIEALQVKRLQRFDIGS